MLVDYLRDPNSPAADALYVAASRGQVLISLISLMELCAFDEGGKANRKSNAQIQAELKAVKELSQKLGIDKIALSKPAQEQALSLLSNPKHRSRLGKNALIDSLIIGAGIARRAHLVTTDEKWAEIVAGSPIRVMSPEELVKEA